MPIFEYACVSCGLPRFSRLVGVVARAPAPVCPRCGSENLKKRVSRFVSGRSEDDVMESIAEQADQIDPDDPHAVRGLLKGMAQRLNEELSGDDIEEIINETTTGDPSAPATKE